jgi:TonB family protein
VDAKKKPVGSHVLVVAMMRPAQLFDPAGGSPPADLAKPGADVPYPASFVRPGYPVKVVGSRSVLVEVLLGTDGNIKQAMVVGPPSGFDSAALQTARSWKFRPAKLEGVPVKSVVYLIFGYRMPV